MSLLGLVIHFLVSSPLLEARRITKSGVCPQDEYHTPMREDRNLLILKPGSRAFYPSSKLNFGPRLALSWSPKKLNNKTVLRIGGGYYYGPGQGEDLIQPIESVRPTF